MAKRQRKPSWFKLWLHDKPLIDAVSDEAVGKALKAAYQYFDAGISPELDCLSAAVFAILKEQVDKANKDYILSVDSGIAGARKRWSENGAADDSPPIPPLTSPIGVLREDRSKKIEASNICSSSVKLLNELSGSSFRATTKSTQRLINARINEGYTQEEIEMVIRHQCGLWGKDQAMQKYLRPETLFGNKFEAYLSDARRSKPQQAPGYILAPLEDPWDVAMRGNDYA